MISLLLEEKREAENRLSVLMEAINYIIHKSALTEKEEVMFRARHIDGKTLEVIGLEVGITRERARQTIAKAIAKMSASNACGHKKTLNYLYALEIEQPKPSK